MNKHASHSDMKRPQKFSRNRSKFSKTLEALGKWKLNHTQNRAKFFLDCFAYEETSSVEAGKKIWIDAETSAQRKFKIALCSESPPGFSRLFVKSDDALLDSPASTLSDGDLSDGDLDGDEKRISVEAVASSYNAILMHTGVYSGTYPRFRHDYFLLVNDVPTPKISRLPEMPGPHELNIGLLHHESGHYTVAVLKETMISTIETDSSMLSGYGKSKLIEGPCVCTFSTSTGKWMCSYVSLPGDLTLENFDIDVVLANDNSFWWVNLRCGILSYDIDQQQPVLGFIPLPPACFLKREIDRHMREDRCVGLCNGELRCVHVFRKKHIFFDYDMTLEQCEDYIKIWTWRNGNWVEDYKMKFAELWKSTTFTAKRLPKFVPLYPTIDPYCPNLVNFFLSTGHHRDGYAIGVDLLSTEIQYCGESKDLLAFMQGLEIYEFSGAPQAS